MLRPRTVLQEPKRSFLTPDIPEPKPKSTITGAEAARNQLSPPGLGAPDPCLAGAIPWSDGAVGSQPHPSATASTRCRRPPTPDGQPLTFSWPRASGKLPGGGRGLRPDRGWAVGFAPASVSQSVARGMEPAACRGGGRSQPSALERGASFPEVPPGHEGESPRRKPPPLPRCPELLGWCSEPPPPRTP